MTKFSQLAPAASISAQQLDENFRMVAPAEDQDIRHCRIVRTPDGWKMETLPGFPSTAALLFFDSAPRWATIPEVIDELLAQGLLDEIEDGGGGPTPESPITAPGAVAPSAISPGANGSLFITTGNASQWSEAPPSGTPAWRQVERCDGQTMYVWGTEWA